MFNVLIMALLKTMGRGLIIVLLKYNKVLKGVCKVIK